MTKKKCIVCGKEFFGRNNSRYCSEECRNTPICTDEFNGEIHGQLKIINAYRKKSIVYAICECKCGNICTVRYDCLLSGNNVSCGCVNKQQNQAKPVELTGKVNQYGCEAIKYLGVGKEGSDWLCRCYCGKEFKVPAGRFYKTKSCGCAKIESRKENIEKAQNLVKEGYEKNTSVISIMPKKMLKNNKSGFRGVCWDKSREQWVAQIAFQGKNYHLGRYYNIEDAVAARKEAEKALFGNFLKWFQETYPERWKAINNGIEKAQKKKATRNNEDDN